MAEEIISYLSPLSTLWNSFVSVLPGISAFIVLIALGILISWIIGKVTRGVLKGTGFDRWFVKVQLNKTLGNISPSAIVGSIVKWWVFIAFFAAASDVLDLGPISNLLVEIAGWLPNAIIAAVIVIAGWIAANVVSANIARRDVKGSTVLAATVKIIILVFVAFTALAQIGIKISLAEKSILIIIAGIMLGVGLAIGRGFAGALERRSELILRNIR